MALMAVSRFERFFREAGDVRVDKDDLKRYIDFVNRVVFDLLIMAQATCRANGRGMMEPHDLPITKGLQESIHAFRSIGEETGLEPVLGQLTVHPQLDVEIGDEVKGRLPEIAGGISVALARTFKIVDPKVTNPGRVEWERAVRIFELLV